MLGPFARPENAQPVVTARPESVFTDPILGKPVHWEALHTFNPAAVVRNGKIYALHDARIFAAPRPFPFLLRIVESEDGTYVLTYTQWNRTKTDAAIATSRDLVHWTKQGPALGTE